MHDTDALIQNITGSKNYVKELEKVTGNIEMIDMNYFKDINKNNMEADYNIRKLLTMPDNVNISISKEFFTLSIAQDFIHAIETHELKSKKSKKAKVKQIIAERFKPKQFINGDYFKIVKKIEKTCNNLIESYSNDNNFNIDTVNNIIKTNPELMETKNLFGKKLLTEYDCNVVTELKKYCHIIIDNYMLPMYDLRSTMIRNWHVLDPLFSKGNIKMKDITISQNEVQDMLYLFMIAKYRCTITENNKYYVKLFMKLINNVTTENNNAFANSTSTNSNYEESAETSIGKMDAARFLELLDTINFDAIDKKQTVYKFASQAKNIITKIVNKKEGESMENIMNEVTELLQECNNTTNETVEENVEIDNSHNNILDDMVK